MLCVSCEMLLETQVNEIKWVKVENVSFKKWTLVVTMWNIRKTDETKNMKKIKKAIEESGYEVTTKQSLEKKKISVSCDDGSCVKRNSEWWLQLILITAIWTTVFLIMQKLNIYQFFSGISDEANMGVALLIGFVASLSTCLAVTGSIVLGFSEYIDDSKGQKWHFRTQLSFQIGRIVGFTILGWLLGLIWQTIQMSLGATAFLTILVGVVILYMGLHMLGFLPNITSLGFSLPKSRSKNICNYSGLNNSSKIN